MSIGFVSFIVRVLNQMSNNNGSNMAAAIAYYGFLSLFPLLLGMFGLLGMFLSSQTIQQQIMSFVQENLPSASDVIVSNIQGVMQYRGTLGIIGIIGLIWVASGVMSALDNAINRAWDVPRTLHFYIRKPRDLGLTLGVGLLFLFSIGASYVFSVVRLDNLPGAGAFLVQASARLVAFILVFLVFLILFKLMPNTRTYWRYIWQGAFFTAVLFEIGRSLFVYYINNFTNYLLVYGSIASVVAALVWIYYSAFVVILGAQLTAEYCRICGRPVTAV